MDNAPNAPAGQTKRRRWALIAALAVATAAALAWWWQRPAAATTTTVRAAPLVQQLQFSARVAARQRVDVGATVTGRVAAVLVAEGDGVRPGQPLVQLEDSELRAALAQAQASERQAVARMAGLRSSGRSGAQAGVAQAEAMLRAAQDDLTRTGQLLASGFVSEARLQDAQRALAVAQAQLDAARAQRQANTDQGSDVTQAQAQLALASAGTQAALARLAQAQVLAPADAKVLLRAVEPGQIVQPGRALLTLALAGPTQLEAPVDERYLRELRPGQPASVQADAFPGQPFDATLRSIAPLVDAQRGAVTVKFEVAQPPAFLREDMTLSIAVRTAQRASALALPLAALRQAAGGGDAVWLAQDGRVQARPVQLGLRTLDQVEVTQGLAAGDQVLVGPAPAPGQRVRTTPAKTTTTAAGAPGGGGVGGGAAGGDGAGAALGNAMGR